MQSLMARAITFWIFFCYKLQTVASSHSADGYLEDDYRLLDYSSFGNLSKDWGLLSSQGCLGFGIDLSDGEDATEYFRVATVVRIDLFATLFDQSPSTSYVDSYLFPQPLSFGMGHMPME